MSMESLGESNTDMTEDSLSSDDFDEYGLSFDDDSGTELLWESFCFVICACFRGKLIIIVLLFTSGFFFIVATLVWNVS